MKKQGSVTVTFSLVFLLMFSFILAFFEMAAYTARSSYHAAAARLAVENFFAAYAEPLYSEYHIFGREIPQNEDIVKWSESEIQKDVLFMTRKKEGQASLLLRSGAEFSVLSAEVLTQQDARGFYNQAVRAMQYRSVLEIADMVKQYLNVAKQMESHLTYIAQQEAAAEAYATMEKELLKLIEQVDGVKLSQYELFLRGKATVFQSNTYVKRFCSMNLQEAAVFFDRVEVYEAFCNTCENLPEKLSVLQGRVLLLAMEVEEREQKQEECRERKEMLTEKRQKFESRLAELGEQIQTAEKALEDMARALSVLQKKSRKTPEDEKNIAILLQAISDAAAGMEGLKTEADTVAAAKTAAEQLLEETQKQEKELLQQQKEQEKKQKQLREEEKDFVKVCREVEKTCIAATEQAAVIKDELKRAILAKERCEKLLETLRPVLGEDAVKGYTKELEKYLIYENAGEYDFEKMVQALWNNRGILEGMSICINGADAASLYAAAKELEKEITAAKNYSFEGLRLNYGEISLAGPIQEQARGILENAASNSFLSLLTDAEIADGQLELSYLPSGLQFAGKETEGIASLLKKDFKELLGRLIQSFSEEGELSDATGAIAEPILFHAYCMEHFADFSKQDVNTVLRYELEYLVGGRAGDAENLSAVLTKIIFFRTALHLVSSYSDSVKRAAVDSAALAACGAIGLPALKAVFVFIFLLIWAIEEAFVDAAALLAGKKLALFPGQNDGSLLFSELLLFSGALVKEKAKEKKAAVGMKLNYRDFLQLYLLMTPKEQKCFRAMDLIQENMRSWYKKSFRLKRCVWKIEYCADKRIYEFSYCD